MTHSDEPVITDLLGHAGHVESVADVIENRQPPFVIGVHGDWGTGKTSFLMKLRWFLEGSSVGYDTREQLDELGKDLWPKTYRGDGRNVETLWFEAWRYQFEPNPVVALLHEIRAHFAGKKNIASVSKKVLDEAGKRNLRGADVNRRSDKASRDPAQQNRRGWREVGA